MGPLHPRALLPQWLQQGVLHPEFRCTVSNGESPCWIKTSKSS